MVKEKKISTKINNKLSGAAFFEHLWEKSWIYIKTVVDVVREPVLILDKDLRVMAANESFYRTFSAESKDTEGKLVYNLGNGQWDIPALRKLLGDVLLKHTFFKGFQVAHEFLSIGRKVMILNGRQIYIKDDAAPHAFPPIILLAMEDVTEMIAVAETLASHAKEIEARLTARTQKLETHIGQLETQLKALKKKE